MAAGATGIPMTELLQTTLDGLLNGGSYALVGLGLTLTFGMLRRLNLAYGAGAMLAAYVGAWLHLQHAAPWGVVLFAVVGVAGPFPCNGDVERILSNPTEAAKYPLLSAMFQANRFVFLQFSAVVGSPKVVGSGATIAAAGGGGGAVSSSS